ncbi:hypothetical protein Z517_07332 [Fonsecaea pedrosoi CBS 271.37]|uniref:Unplaced genomic scaffold supercont1.4, whole genome shotgun sequence n=1 Tax=Fonsecaea pedrosoi CBS 271.37 TaxID=1442368 RepID=A0A0D2DS73_9EURO|nr:uncharacterized protein Z517_07332 [Fonsecaea pedrosoi CBS 271.37]KIW80716.1 hypothetical protein Z517_07332 [Fonsecaea pedrosoi CBS 271.37]
MDSQGIKVPFNWLNFWTCMALSFGMFVNGYLSGVIGTTLADPGFVVYMGLVDRDGNPTDNSEALIGASTGIFQAGGFVGVLIGSWLLDRFGRKRTAIIVAALCAIFQAITAASQNVGMFIALRFFVGAAAFMEMSITPVYVAELAPTKTRGLTVGITGVWVAVGYAVAAYFGAAFFNLGETIQWRLPLALGAAWPLILLPALLIIPESPRYLLMKDRSEEALAVVLKQHAAPGHEDDARAEFFQMQQQAELDCTLDASWIGFLKHKTHRRRGGLVLILGFLAQTSGNLVVNNYGPSLYGALGYGPFDQVRFQCGYITTAIIFSIIGSLLVDGLGRRLILISGLAGCACMISLEAAMVACFAQEGTNKAGLAVGVAALYLFESCYCFSVDVCLFVVSSELFPNHLRSKGVALAIGACTLTNIVLLTTAPTAFQHVGWKFFLLFIITTACGVVFLYFFLPETSSIPLEETATVFGLTDEVAIKAKDIYIDHTTHEITVHHQDDIAEVGQTKIRQLEDEKERRSEHKEVAAGV